MAAKGRARKKSETAARDDRPVVFVSSTYLDNVERRAWVREAIERAGMVPLAMERWTASSLGARELCVDKVAEADVFVGILAWRYGWIPDGEAKSITELEYDEAGRRALPRLMFAIDQRLQEVNVVTEFDAEDPWNKQALLDAFKRRAAGEVSLRPFKDAELKTLVLQALFEWKEERAKARGEPRASAPTPFEPLARHEQELADYLQAVEAEHAHLTLPGFEKRLRVPLSLDDLYVQVDLARGHEELDGAAHEKDAPREDEPPTILSALARLVQDPRSKGLVVLGHPGSGKTTQLRRLALLAARGGLVEYGLSRECVPVFLPLRKLTASDDSLGALACRLLADPDLGLGPGFGDWLWRRGRLLLLVDGLDEVPKSRRGHVKDWIETVARGRKENMLVVTSRKEGYVRGVELGPQFTLLSLRPLADDQADLFVRRWYEAVEAGVLALDADDRAQAAARRAATESAAALVAELHAPSVRASRVYELAHNPLLLTALCLVHRDRAKLPERAAELYKEAVEVLLQHWRDAKRLPLSFKAGVARQVLQRVALWLHEKDGRTQGSEDELCDLLQPHLQGPEWRELDARSFLATVRDESGLLTGYSAERFGFLHLGFQEYLAALELHRRVRSHLNDPEGLRSEVDAIAQHFGPTWWREVLALLFAIDEDGYVSAELFRALMRHPRLAEHKDLALQCAREAGSLDPTPFRELLRLPVAQGLWANRRVAADLLLARGPLEVSAEDLAPLLELVDRKAGRTPAQHEEQLLGLQTLMRLAPAEAISRAERLAEHPHPDVRAYARDWRVIVVDAPTAEVFAAARSASVEILRPQAIREERSGCELVFIPGGRFLMGSPPDERGRRSDEGPQHEVELGPFYLARHPVTNEQYKRFLAAVPSAKPPAYWGDRDYNQANQPVVGVSWEEAKAFCAWASLELPSEAQWEHACRAGTRTRYWSGDADEDLARVGWYGMNSGGRLHSVGEKPASPWGLLDMHGNVWEWCADAWSSDYSKSQRSHPGAYEESGSPGRVYRGGSFRNSAEDARSACRTRWWPGYRSGDLGFRPARGITTG